MGKQTRNLWLALAVFFLMGAVLVACGDDEESDPDTTTPSDTNPADVGPEVLPITPEDGVATDITLTIYSDGWGNLLDTVTLATEGPAVISVEEAEPYSDPPTYYIYAHAEGFYTELYYATKGDSIEVDLDAVPDAPDAVAGVVFATQGFFADVTFSSAAVTLNGPNGFSTTLTTDDQGRFGLQNLPSGAYTMDFNYQDMDFSLAFSNSMAGTDYTDLSFAEPMQAAAPNLYIYPTETTDVSVRLAFPQGGEVVVSEPEYGEGWDVSIDPDGFVDGTYGYLFYEASLPQTFQTTEGWMLDGSDFEGELRALLTELGFAGREIDDFVDFWVPRLGGSAHYAVYPQFAEALVTVDITPAPERILRALFVIRPVPAPMELTPPEVTPFDRSGYFATEWGVLIGL